MRIVQAGRLPDGGHIQLEEYRCCQVQAQARLLLQIHNVLKFSLADLPVLVSIKF